jgi:hypothetical protein
MYLLLVRWEDLAKLVCETVQLLLRTVRILRDCAKIARGVSKSRGKLKERRKNRAGLVLSTGAT